MRLLMLLIFIVATSLSSFVNSNPIPIEAYGQLPSKSLMVISPNSERLAYRDTKENQDIMVIIDLVTNKMLAAINIGGLNPSNAYFIDNERLVLVASDNKRIVGFTGRHVISAAFAYNLSTKKIHQLLIQGKGIYRGQSQLGNIVGLSADKKFAFMPAYESQSKFNLYKVSLEKKRTPRTYIKGTADTIDFFLGEDGEVLARERYNNKSNLHRIESRIDDEWVEIFRQETPYRTKGFNGVTPDRKSLVMLSQDGNHGRWAYYTMSLKDGKISEPIFTHENKDVEHVITDIQRVVYGVKYSGFTPTYEFFDENLNARMRGMERVMPNNSIAIHDYTPDWSSMLFYIDGENTPGDYYLYKSGQLKFLTSARPLIPTNKVNPVEIYNYKARDGLTIPSLLTTPLDVEAKNLPAIIHPHGGPESYDKLGFDWMTQYFASQGYVVVQPQFRGSDGFGSDFLHEGRGQWGRKMQDDLTDAVNDLIEKGVIDKNRVCILGASYGGYAALAGATFTPDLYRCVVAINGVSDVEEMLEDEESDYGSDHWVVSYWQDVISKGEVDEDHLAQISPINHVDKIKAPVLLIHGEYDKVVPFSQSDDMFDEMEDADKDVTFIELDEGNHHLSKAENRMIALKAIDAFLKKHNP